jgi:hypothetical protein
MLPMRCYDISRPATDACWWLGSDRSRDIKKSPSIGRTNPNRALAAQFGRSVGGFSEGYIFPLIHSCVTLVRPSDMSSSTATACTDKLRARWFSSRFRFRRIDSKSSTILLDLFITSAPVIWVCNHPNRSCRHGGYRHALLHSWTPIRVTMTAC